MSASRPTVHWIYAHPQENSFNARLFRDGVEALSRDHDVEILSLIHI